MSKCLFCSDEIISISDEHIVPESLGNKNLFISGVVCDKCNNGVLSDLDNYFCQNNIFAENKMFYVKKTKKGKFPKLSKLNGKIEKTDVNKIKFIQNPKTKNAFYIKVTKNSWEFCFNFVKRGINPKKISQFLTKVGIESIFYFKDKIAYYPKFDEAREYTIHSLNDNFIPFSWRKTRNKQIGIFISEAIKNNSDKYYISILRLHNCDYFIQLNDPFSPTALKILNSKFNLNYVENDQQIVPDIIKSSIKFNSIPNEDKSI